MICWLIYLPRLTRAPVTNCAVSLKGTTNARTRTQPAFYVAFPPIPPCARFQSVGLLRLQAALLMERADDEDSAGALWVRLGSDCEVR